MQGIYKITNIRTKEGSCYVGSSVSIESRWAWHVKDLEAWKHHSYKLQRAWKRFGPKTFTFEVVELVTSSRNLLKREQHYIDTLPSHYNVAREAGRPPSPPKIIMIRGRTLPVDITGAQFHNTNDLLIRRAMEQA